MNRDYSKIVIYKIESNNLDITDCYIGSTVNFHKRFAQHKNSCKNPNRIAYSYKVYKFIRENGGWDNWSMKILEFYPCNNKGEAYERECHYIECNNTTLNTHRSKSNETRRLYCIKHANKLKEYQKLYHQNYRFFRN